MANTKWGHMDRFEDTPACVCTRICGLKDLTEELRNTLFRSRDLAPFTGTYKDRSIMYNRMISAFNKATGHF